MIQRQQQQQQLQQQQTDGLLVPAGSLSFSLVRLMDNKLL